MGHAVGLSLQCLPAPRRHRHRCHVLAVLHSTLSTRRPLPSSLQAFDLLGQLEDEEDVENAEFEAPQPEPKEPAPRMPPRPVRVRSLAALCRGLPPA